MAAPSAAAPLAWDELRIGRLPLAANRQRFRTNCWPSDSREGQTSGEGFYVNFRSRGELGKAGRGIDEITQQFLAEFHLAGEEAFDTSLSSPFRKAASRFTRASAVSVKSLVKAICMLREILVYRLWFFIYRKYLLF